MIDKASLAMSLRDNEAFQEVLDIARSDALEALATLKIADADAFYTHQATVRVVDSIRSDLDAFIRAGKPAKPPGIA